MAFRLSPAVSERVSAGIPAVAERVVAAVVAEVRSLERKRDQAEVFDARRDQAIAFVTWAQRQEAPLRRRLQEVAEVSGLDVNALREEAAKRTTFRASDRLDRLLPQLTQDPPMTLRSVVA